jgi:hypothetical protein
MSFGDIWDSPIVNFVKRAGQALSTSGISEIVRQIPQEPLDEFINKGIGAPLGWGLGLNDLSAADAFSHWVPPAGEYVEPTIMNVGQQSKDWWHESGVRFILDSELVEMGLTTPEERFKWRQDFVSDYHGHPRVSERTGEEDLELSETDTDDGPTGLGGPRGPSLDDLLAQQQQILRDMVARGMMGVDEAEAAYTQAVASIYADFQNEQQITRSGFDTDVAARGTQRQQDRQDSMDALIAAGVDPRGSAGDQLASDQAYNAGTDAQSEYLDALMRISEMGEGSRQLAGEREFGGARRSLNETQAQGFAGLESQAALARALSGISGTSPADIFAGMLSGMDTIGMQQGKNAAAASSAASDQQYQEMINTAINLTANGTFDDLGSAIAVLSGQIDAKYILGQQDSGGYPSIDEQFASMPVGLRSEATAAIQELMYSGFSYDDAAATVLDSYAFAGQ